VIIVLQGDDVTIQLTGDTHISKEGITTSTFNIVPDAPVSSSQITVLEGLYSNLPATPKSGFHKQKLNMPTELQAQNGIVTNQPTKTTITGCKKPRHAKHTKRKGPYPAVRPHYAPRCVGAGIVDQHGAHTRKTRQVYKGTRAPLDA
jgi:hypothetical protein